MQPNRRVSQSVCLIRLTNHVSHHRQKKIVKRCLFETKLTTSNGDGSNPNETTSRNWHMQSLKLPVSSGFHALYRSTERTGFCPIRELVFDPPSRLRQSDSWTTFFMDTPPDPAIHGHPLSLDQGFFSSCPLLNRIGHGIGSVTT